MSNMFYLTVIGDIMLTPKRIICILYFSLTVNTAEKENLYYSK